MGCCSQQGLECDNVVIIDLPVLCELYRIDVSVAGCSIYGLR